MSFKAQVAAAHSLFTQNRQTQQTNNPRIARDKQKKDFIPFERTLRRIQIQDCKNPNQARHGSTGAITDAQVDYLRNSELGLQMHTDVYFDSHNNYWVVDLRSVSKTTPISELPLYIADCPVYIAEGRDPQGRCSARDRCRLHPDEIASDEEILKLAETFCHASGARVLKWGHVVILFESQKMLRRQEQEHMPGTIGGMTFSFAVSKGGQTESKWKDLKTKLWSVLERNEVTHCLMNTVDFAIRNASRSTKGRKARPWGKPSAQETRSLLNILRWESAFATPEQALNATDCVVWNFVIHSHSSRVSVSSNISFCRHQALVSGMQYHWHIGHAKIEKALLWRSPKCSWGRSIIGSVLRVREGKERGKGKTRPAVLRSFDTKVEDGKWYLRNRNGEFLYTSRYDAGTLVSGGGHSPFTVYPKENRTADV
jgi:hypothetical protein